MFEIITSSLVLLGYAAYDYKKRRFSSPEDRYMVLYGRDEWASNDMDMYIRFREEDDAHIKAVWCKRVEDELKKPDSLLHETAVFHDKKISYARNLCTLADLLSPRQGIYFDISQKGIIHIIWNHMQLDGVGLWYAIRTLFDENPPLIPYRDVKPPPPVLPEILSLPKVAGQAMKRGVLYKAVSDTLHTGHAIWDATEIRKLKEDLQAPFNLLTSAIVAYRIFARHPKVEKLNVGLTVFFPFLKARNRYGVLIVRVKRGSIAEIVAHLQKKIPKPLVMWGNTAAQAYAMERVPESMFLQLMKYYRKQIDVLISNVPVGSNPISIGENSVGVFCHTRGLSLPYYFLLMGTRNDIHCSYSTLFPQDDDFFHHPNLDEV